MPFHEREYDGDVVTVTVERADGSREIFEATGNHPFWVESGEGLAGRPLAIDDAGMNDALYVSPSGGRYVEA